MTKSEDAFDPSNLSAEELEKQIADIEFKSRVAGALRKGSEAQRSLKRLKVHTFTMSNNKTGGRP
jgi:hypothetical protein